MTPDSSADSIQPCHLNPERHALLRAIGFPREIARADGAYLHLANGRCLLDVSSQYGATPFGHNPGFVWAEIARQGALGHGVMVQPFESEAARRLAAALIEASPIERGHVVFGGSGTEAVEAGIKAARARTGRHGILSLSGGYHGKTMGACLATGGRFFTSPFYPSDAHFSKVACGDETALRRELASRRHAALIVEPIQGEGGMVVPPEGYLRACRRACTESGTLLVIDEIQTGLGRTGRLFACEREGIVPDILLIAKALGGGVLPVGACVIAADAWSRTFGERHGSTFANNQIGCAVGCAVLARLTDTDEILANVRSQGARLSEGLAALVDEFPSVFEGASGRGLMQGLKFREWEAERHYASRFASSLGFVVPLVSGYLLAEHDVLTLPTLGARNVLRLQPNLSSTDAELERLLDALSGVGRAIEKDAGTLIRVAAGLPARSSAVRTPPSRPVTARPRARAGRSVGTFAFLMHPTTEADFLGSLPSPEGTFAPAERAALLGWRKRARAASPGAGVACRVPEIRSARGSHADGWLIASLSLPREMMRLSREAKSELLASYVEAARVRGADMMGLGAFTSVISRSGLDLVGCGVPVTTGNAYTALSSTGSLRAMCRRSGRRLDRETFGVLGAGGSVGRLAALDLAPSCEAVELIGRAGGTGTAKLEYVAGELLASVLFGTETEGALANSLARVGVTAKALERFAGPGDANDRHRALYRAARALAGSAEALPIRSGGDLSHRLTRCGLLLGATNAGGGVIGTGDLRAGAIVCDVARPSDVHHELAARRPDVTVYEGGVVVLPEPQSLGDYNLAGLRPGLCLACAAETIVLTLERQNRDFGIGVGVPR